MQLLEVLRYLASRRPAVVHRDISPGNVIVDDARDGGGGAGGEDDAPYLHVSLVDFGGVQRVLAPGTGELAGKRGVPRASPTAASGDDDDASGPDSPPSTVVGTFGYMAPEQFAGAASPASDLYSLGAVLLFLLSGE